MPQIPPRDKFASIDRAKRLLNDNANEVKLEQLYEELGTNYGEEKVQKEIRINLRKFKGDNLDEFDLYKPSSSWKFSKPEDKRQSDFVQFLNRVRDYFYDA